VNRQVPIYDFRQSKRTGYTTVEPPESRVVVVEGIYALSSRLRDLMDMRVSIKGGIHFDLVRVYTQSCAYACHQQFLTKGWRNQSKRSASPP